MIFSCIKYICAAIFPLLPRNQKKQRGRPSTLAPAIWNNRVSDNGKKKLLGKKCLFIHLFLEKAHVG